MQKLLPRHVEIIEMIDEEVMLEYIHNQNPFYLRNLFMFFLIPTIPYFPAYSHHSIRVWNSRL